MAPKNPTQKDQTTLRRSSRLSSLAPAVSPPKKKQKPNPPKPKSIPTPESPDVVVEGSKKTIVVEHCKQCSSFKSRAMQVKKGLEEAVFGVEVVLNPEKPRRGCFEVREEDGQAFVTLLAMKRPFTQMKKLDMDKLISDIVQKIN